MMMGILRRSIFREVLTSAFLGTVLFTFVLFLRNLSKLFELLVRSSASADAVGYLFALVLPQTLTFTLPLGVLVGVLIALSRLSSDGEIIGMRAAGVPGRYVLTPILVFSSLGMAVTAACSLWLTPFSIRESYRVMNKLAAEQLTAEIQPRIFEEQFPNVILYVSDVLPGPVVRWRNVFLADIRPPDERAKNGQSKRGEGPRITLAREAIAVPDIPHNRIQLTMNDWTTHEADKDPVSYYSTSAPRGTQSLQASRPSERRAKPFQEMDTGPLWREARRSVEARIELHQRLTLPLACILLPLVGIPLGVSSRKSGKSAAFVITVFLAFLYYMTMITLIGLAKQGTLSAPLALWTPNIVFAVTGLILMLRLEAPGDRDLVAATKARFAATFSSLRWEFKPVPVVRGRGWLARLPLLPQILDTYILSSFGFYFVLLLVSLVLMTEVFTFFELLSDILKNKIPMVRVLTYLFFLTPKLIYDSTPMSVLVAVLVTFGVLTKQNEVTAFKATGISLYRLSVPVLLVSATMSAALFAFDHYYVADANRRQDAIRKEIKGKPVQTYLRPGQTWIMGQGPRMYYYKYFDPTDSVMGGVNVYELDMASFRLRRHISAERAHWEPTVKTWIFEKGWVRNLATADGQKPGYQDFHVATFSDLDEPPSWFLKEVKEDKQMNFRELTAYIRELQQSGFDTVRLQVQLQKKFSVPLFALIMALIAVPFAFMTGNRGAMAGVGVSFGIAIAYWAVSQLFEQVGNLNQLPPALAAWAPDTLFSLAGMYLMTRLRT
jgi:LPS export ABC transporter permease LptG/LPS export ABC transporter permease LptF